MDITTTPNDDDDDNVIVFEENGMMLHTFINRSIDRTTIGQANAN